MEIDILLSAPWVAGGWVMYTVGRLEAVVTQSWLNVHAMRPNAESIACWRGITLSVTKPRPLAHLSARGYSQRQSPEKIRFASKWVEKSSGNPDDTHDNVEAELLAHVVFIAPHAVLVGVPESTDGRVHAALFLASSPDGVLQDGAIDGELVGRRRALGWSSLRDQRGNHFVLRELDLEETMVAKGLR